MKLRDFERTARTSSQQTISAKVRIGCPPDSRLLMAPTLILSDSVSSGGGLGCGK